MIPKVGGNTPWGSAQSVREIAPGIWFVTTAGHGGFYLSPEQNEKVNVRWRHDRFNSLSGWDNWYEEDCESAKVVLTFPDLFPSNQEDAHIIAKQVYPTAYHDIYEGGKSGTEGW